MLFDEVTPTSGVVEVFICRRSDSATQYKTIETLKFSERAYGVYSRSRTRKTGGYSPRVAFSRRHYVFIADRCRDNCRRMWAKRSILLNKSLGNRAERKGSRLENNICFHNRGRHRALNTRANSACGNTPLRISRSPERTISIFRYLIIYIVM